MCDIGVCCNFLGHRHFRTLGGSKYEDLGVIVGLKHVLSSFTSMLRETVSSLTDEDILLRWVGDYPPTSHSFTHLKNHAISKLVLWRSKRSLLYIVRTYNLLI